MGGVLSGDWWMGGVLSDYWWMVHCIHSPLQITPSNIAHTINRVAGSVDPAESGGALGSDGHFGLSVPDIKTRVEGLPNADLCEHYVFKVKLLLFPTSDKRL